MKAIYKRITAENIPTINAEGLNGEYLAQNGYYRITLEDRPEVYAYANDFGGLLPEETAPFLYLIPSKHFGDLLRIDLAAIANDENRHPVKTIPVVFVEEVSGENARIFKQEETGKHYKRVSSYPREAFARWVSVRFRQGVWEDVGEIRANIVFELGGETERITATNWNGPAVYGEHFNRHFEEVRP